MKHNIFYIALVLSLFSSESLLASAICGKLEKVKGKVEILRVKLGQEKIDNPVRTITFGKRKMKLRCSDVLLTTKGARVKVRLINKAVMSMGPFSRISIAEYAVKSGDVDLINLTYGKVRTFFKNKEVNKKKRNKSDKVNFKIKTPGAVVGVRGTDFYVNYEPNAKVTEQATLKGTVEVEQLGSGQKVLVNKGEQVNIDKVVRTPVEEPEILKDPNEKRVLRSGERLPLKKLPVLPAKQSPIVPIKPLVVQKIAMAVIEDIKETSAIVQEDKQFATEEAVSIIGKPDSWKVPELQIPDDLEDIKQEF
ncbi:MAG: FecR domain-containing protein [Bdellovibrionaceae bacterium]|jgi:hypothetical protein|nr:FecR domain-containing protein [Pseudobdellovibrionaceae bacterium]